LRPYIVDFAGPEALTKARLSLYLIMADRGEICLAAIKDVTESAVLCMGFEMTMPASSSSVIQ